MTRRTTPKKTKALRCTNNGSSKTSIVNEHKRRRLISSTSTSRSTTNPGTAGVGMWSSSSRGGSARPQQQREERQGETDLSTEMTPTPQLRLRIRPSTEFVPALVLDETDERTTIRRFAAFDSTVKNDEDCVFFPSTPTSDGERTPDEITTATRIPLPTSPRTPPNRIEPPLVQPSCPLDRRDSEKHAIVIESPLPSYLYLPEYA